MPAAAASGAGAAGPAAPEGGAAGPAAFSVSSPAMNTQDALAGSTPGEQPAAMPPPTASAPPDSASGVRRSASTVRRETDTATVPQADRIAVLPGAILFPAVSAAVPSEGAAASATVSPANLAAALPPATQVAPALLTLG